MRYLMTGPHRLGTMECFGQAGQEVYSRPEASWRKMLVVQPPVDVLRIYQRRSGGMGIQWNMWDIVESSEEDEGYYRRASQHVVVENEPKDSVTLVYVDWWIDRNAPVGNSRQEVEGP